MFPDLQELVAKFQKPDQGLVVALLRPIPRSDPCLHWRSSKLQLDTASGACGGPLLIRQCLGTISAWGGHTRECLGPLALPHAKPAHVLPCPATHVL